MGVAMETADIFLRKAKFEDWQAMYKNVWSSAETAKYMAWNITTNEKDAQARMERTIAYQKTHDTYLVYEKESGMAVGFAGIEKVAPRVYQETGIALGPEYVGKGYGKQILKLLLDYCAERLNGKEFYYHTRSGNVASKALAESLGFSYQHAEEKVDLRTGEPYMLEVYCKKLKTAQDDKE